MFKIGSFLIKKPVVLAPMAGVTDRPFRQLCMRLGAGMTVAEMLTSDLTLWKSQKSQLRMNYFDEPAPRTAQIVGSDPLKMAEAAQLISDHGAQIIDINMGCPAKKVCKKLAGSALMKDPKLVESILKAVVLAVDVPVTLKIRTGWDCDNKNAVLIAQIAEQSGISALTVHGRTRACKFQGEAEYETIAKVCQSVNIPVIANGDINSAQKAKQVLTFTQAQAVMVGRAAQGRPWLLGQIAHYLQHNQLLPEPSDTEKNRILLNYIAQLYDFYGEIQGVRITRKHVGWFFMDTNVALEVKKQFNQLTTAVAQQEYLNTYFKQSC